MTIFQFLILIIMVNKLLEIILYCKFHLNLNELFGALYNSTVILFAHLVRTRHIRFRSQSPRSHVKPSAVVCAPPKIQVSHALNTALLSLVHTHHEGGNTWAIGCTYNGYMARRFPLSLLPYFLVCPR